MERLRGIAAAFGPAILVIALAVAGVFAIREVEASRARIESVYRVQAGVDHLLKRVLDVETATRAFMLSGSDLYLEPYHGAPEDLDATLARLGALATEPQERAALQGLARVVRARAESARASIRLVRAGALTPVEREARLLEGKRLMDEVRGQAAAFRDIEQRQLAALRRRDRDRLRLALIGLITGGLAAAALTATASILTQRRAVERSRAASALEESNLRLEEQAVELEIQANELQEQALELEQHAESLQQQEAYLRSVIDADPNIIFAKTPDGRIALANRAMAGFMGTTPDDLIGHTEADFGMASGHVEAFLASDQAVLESGRPLLVDEQAVASPATGETRWLRTLKVPLPPRDGGSPQVLGVAVDITEHRALEQQLRQAQKMDAVGRLAGGIAHDFNNLLAVIKGSAELLLMDLPESDPCRTDAEQITAAADRAAALTRQLLAFSRKQPHQPQLLDPNALVRNLTAMLERLMGRRIRLRAELDPDVPNVVADPGQLEQVITNLVVNARDASPDGGEIVLATASAPGPDGDAAIILVRDSGTGMSPEVLEHIWEPFYTTKEAGQGTGLGLAVVYGIVRQAGGLIDVDSAPGQGATFTVRLPAARAEQG